MDEHRFDVETGGEDPQNNHVPYGLGERARGRGALHASGRGPGTGRGSRGGGPVESVARQELLAVRMCMC